MKTDQPFAFLSPRTRRSFLARLTASAALFSVPGVFAEELIRTPRQTEGPFYPDHLPLDTDNDLLVINDGIAPAVGEVTYLSGRILDGRGDPIRNAVVEIWQCDNNGAYLHSKTGNSEKRDKNFQGFGRFVTGSSGEYLFRTIKPVPYPGRTPHIHYKIKRAGRNCSSRNATSRAIPETPGWHLQGNQGREGAGVRHHRFCAAQGARANELAARFDVVLGLTPAA
jgi:protocatechuate 3,4-dioxygenase beta subunit